MITYVDEKARLGSAAKRIAKYEEFFVFVGDGVRLTVTKLGSPTPWRLSITEGAKRLPREAEGMSFHLFQDARTYIERFLGTTEPA